MGLTSKLQASGRTTGAVPPSAQQQSQQYGATPIAGSAQGQSGYQSQSQPQSQYGQASQAPPAVNAANRPPQQSQYGQPGQSQYGQQPPQYGQQPQYGQPAQSSYGQQPPQQSQYGQQPQYGQPAQSSYGQPPVPNQQSRPAQQQQYGAPPQSMQGQPPQQPGGPGFGAPNPGYGNQGPNSLAPGQIPGQMQQPPHPSQAQGGSVIAENLTRIVRENQLEIFYPQQRLQQIIQKVSAIDFRGLSQAWDIPMEIATDLAAMALYDIVLYCDDSGSMRAEEHGERIDDLKLILGRVSEVATMFDDDGIQIRFMNNAVEGNGIKTQQQAVGLVDQVRFSGITPLATNLDRKVIQPLVMQQLRSRGLSKPVLCIVITDGEPVGEPKDLIRRVIAGSAQQAAQAGYPGAVRYQFAQVGKDMKAQRFIGELDNDPQIGGLIDAISYFELEAMEYEKKGVVLSPDMWLVKLCVGAIDKSYDEQDE